MACVYGLAAVWLWISDMWLLLKFVGCGWMGIQLRYLWRNPYPHPQLAALMMQDAADARWLLLYKHGGQQIFMQHKCLIEMGLFFLLELSSETDKKLMVVFFDQLAVNDYKLLCVLEACDH